MDETRINLATSIVQKTLAIALETVLDLKEDFIKVQDFDNAAKWRDIGDLIKKGISMTEREVR